MEKVISKGPIVVEYLPDSVEGKKHLTETIMLRRLPITELYIWCRHFAANSTPDLVAYAAGRKIEWVDSLTDESFQEVSERTQAINFERAMKMVEKDAIIASILGPVLRSIQRECIHLELLGVNSKESSSKPPQSTSVVETSIESATPTIPTS